MASRLIQTVGFALLLCSHVAGVSTKGPCQYEDYERVAQCYQDWGHDASVVPHPDAVVWNMTTLISYCRNPHRERVAGCLTDAFSRCQFSEWEEENEALARLSEMSDEAVNYMCWNIDVLEDNKQCIESADYGMSKCVGDASNVAEQAYMELTLADEEMTWEQVKSIKKSQAQMLLECVDKLMTEKCSREVAVLFTNFFYAGYSVYADE